MQDALDENGIKEQALAWIQLMNSGLTSAQKQQLVAWINQHEQHHRAFVEQAGLLNNEGYIQELSGIFPISLTKPTSSHYRHSSLKYPLIFTGLVLLALLLFFQRELLINVFSSSKIEQFQTQVGERSTIVLADGSEVTLNTDSIITVTYADEQRIIELIQGEAQFNVAKDKHRPFIVLSGEKSFTALGTIFNIEKDNAHDMEIIVTEGRVLIGERLPASNKTYLPLNNERLLIDQDAVVSSGKKSVIRNTKQVSNAMIHKKQITQDLAWQQGALIFEHEPLLEVLQEISRYSHMQFEVRDQQLLSLNVSGYFKVDDINGLLASLSNNLGIEYQKTSTNSIELTFPNSR